MRRRSRPAAPGAAWPSERRPPRRRRGSCPATAASSSTVASRTRLTLPKWRSSWRWRPGPMPGMSESAERSVSRRRLAAVEADGEAVGLVAQLLQDEHLGAVGADGDGVLRVAGETRDRASSPPSGAAAGLASRAAPVRARAAPPRRGPPATGVRRRAAAAARRLGRGVRPRRPPGVASARRRWPLGRPSASATSRSLASATIGSPTPARTSMPTSRAAASAIASCPLPPSTTMRSGSFQVPAVLAALRARAGTGATAPRTSRRSRRCGGGRPRRARGADLVGAVAALLGAAVDEDHHRGDGGEPLQVRDVVALDDARQAAPA